MSDKYIKWLQELITDIENGKLVIDDLDHKWDTEETTGPNSKSFEFMSTGVSRVSFRLQNPEKMKKYRQWIKDNGLTEHYA